MAQKTVPKLVAKRIEQKKASSPCTRLFLLCFTWSISIWFLPKHKKKRVPAPSTQGRKSEHTEAAHSLISFASLVTSQSAADRLFFCKQNLLDLFNRFGITKRPNILHIGTKKGDFLQNS
ncbi:hypothetical protein FQS88_17150 [Enterococcus casseliflavus]|nr:hypothetical protein [Enterococcus casseliflavus]